VVGGDGTINEVANGMLGSSVPLGILPGGTANVLAQELGIGSNLERAVDHLSQCEPITIAVGRLRSESAGLRHFLLMTGVGLDAHIVYHLNPRSKAALGKIAYWLGGFRQVGRRFEEFGVRVDGQVYQVSFALASRVKNYGGDLTIARSASLLQPDFELVLFTGENSFTYLKYFAGVLTGRLARMRGITVLRSREAEFLGPTRGPIHVQIDGEYGGKIPARIELVPDALRLLVPQAFLRTWTTSPTR
jgi:diacylglycerol kinase (ATP)